MKKIALLFFALISVQAFSQQPASNANDVEKGLNQKQQLIETSLVKNLPFKNIGPSVMSGRITEISVNPDNPTEFYIGYASGGVWYSDNNGTSFTPILDNSPTQNVGSLTVDWKTKTIWVGTGEVNASRSSYAGIGLLKSTDHGKTWENMGLTDSHHISSILTNPKNSNEIVVSAVGHLYSPNEERGVFKSADGGETWIKTLFVNNQSGIIEMQADPNNFNLMYASSWDKDRKAWNFKGSGEGSAIYKSIDAGTTWIKVSGEGSGFPTGDGVGRIGIAIYDENTVYAIHDNQFRREDDSEKKKDEGLTKEDFKMMTPSELLNLEAEKLSKYLKSNSFPEKYSVESVKKSVREGTVKPIDLAKYLEDANSLLFDTPVIGAEVYKSIDGGKTWNKTHEGYLDGLYYSYGYYFGKIHVDPSNKEGVYIYGVPILKSKDGGKTFTSISKENVHADHHDLWINPKMTGHLIDGNDGGLNISYDDGENWIKCNTPPVGQYYTVNVDNEKPYNIYGGLQDNGVWVGSHTNEESTDWHQSGNYPFKFIMGGDGMQVEIDNRNSNIVYTGFQFGNYFRLNREIEEQTYIQPKHELGENPYRFNWQTPILLSPHNQDILYLGGNKLIRSMNQGDDWEAISEDLTKGGKKGNVAYGTLTSISESPYQFGLIYTGSDDGLVQLTKNGGGNWTTISSTFPKDLWVSRVIASQHKKERVYVTLNGYRWDDFTPYVYMSDNYGMSWKDISSNLPVGAVNVIKEDPKNENVLYLGTDNGVYVSLNKGETWHPFSEGLPNVAFHDLVIQPEANDLVLGTHGRSVYVANISILQNSKEGEVLISEIEPIHYSSYWGDSRSQWSEVYEPSVAIQFYNPKAENITISIKTEDGVELQSYKLGTDKGVNMFDYDVTLSEKGKKALAKKDIEISEAKNEKYYLPKGNYLIHINGKKTALEIK
ncbi:MAG: glycosyl hydrolase [Flavobacteriaceae bacterium]|nr:glycosyl hydrolase [Flavobacteriaceae bacterium]